MSVILLPVWMVTVKTCSSDSRHCSISHIQIEQDMGMIVGKADIPLLFEKAWVISCSSSPAVWQERKKKGGEGYFLQTCKNRYVHVCVYLVPGKVIVSDQRL